MTVKRYYETETDTLELGDVTTIEVDEKQFTATAIQERADGMLFVFDEIIGMHPMNEDGRTEGGYKESDLRKRLRELADTIPEEIRDNMIPFENGDLLTIPTRKDLEEIAYFKNEKNRVATFEGETDWWWLQDVVSASNFAYVGNNGFAYYLYASNTHVGCRPFALFHLESPREVAAQ